MQTAITIIGAIFMSIIIWADISSSIEKEHKKKERAQLREEKYKKRQVEIDCWKEKRNSYAELRQTDNFKKWKLEQYSCQNGRCAWCKRPISLHSQYTHVDHINPLYKGGTNNADNLVLACSYCNKRKGDRQYGYNDERNGRAYNSKPTWIKPNKYEDFF